MPTNDEGAVLPPLVRTVANTNTTHATCPPDDECPQVLSQALENEAAVPELNSDPPGSSPSSDNSEESQTSAGVAELPGTPVNIQQEQEQDEPTTHRGEVAGPTTAEETVKKSDQPHIKAGAAALPITSSPFPPLSRATDHAGYPSMPQHTSSFLKHGSKFVGTQHSDRQVYNVSVELKHVDMRESFICGYLRIEGLTDTHPTLTTYFEGEIIGNKYTFQTRHPEWGSNIKVDMQHWNRFPAWRPLARAAQQSDFSYRNYAEREHLFMRWKEYFLVPDHRVRSISGASFEGFYFICFNQVLGTISGIYFHSKSEKFQQLELKHVHDYGSKTAMEFA